MWLLIKKIIAKTKCIYNVKVFKNFTRNYNKKVKILGEISLINQNITCGNNVTFYPHVTLFGDGLIEIGDNVAIGEGTIIYSSKENGGIKIDNDTMIAAQCYIIDTDHGIRRGELIRNQCNTVAPIYIGKDVWISAGCKILKGSIINDGAVIGAMSLVKGEIPSNAIAMGVPAAVKKYRE